MAQTYQIADILNVGGGSLSGMIFAFMLIFARLGGTLMFMPGIGENYVSPRARLLLALAITLLLTPVLGGKMPVQPNTPAALVLLLGTEITVGVFLGLIVRLMVGALDFAGQIVSLQMGIGSAVAFNPAMSTQGSLPGTMMGMLGIVLMFTTNLHHLLLMGIVESYNVLPVALPGTGGSTVNMMAMSQAIVTTVGQSFAVALMISAPFLILGTLFQVGMALLSRLQPSVQIYFVSMPAQIYFGLAMFGVLVGMMISLWLDHVADIYAQLGLVAVGD